MLFLCLKEIKVCEACQIILFVSPSSAAAKQTAYSNTGSASAYTSHQQAAVQKPAQTKTVVTYAYAPQTTTQTYASTPATTSYSGEGLVKNWLRFCFYPRRIHM